MSDSSAGITEEMIQLGADALIEYKHAQTYPVEAPAFPALRRRLAGMVLEAALAGRTAPEPEINWPTVEAAVHRAVTHYARAYWIPANFLCGGVPEAMQRMAENWAKISAPFITACIQEELRKAAAVSSKGGDPSHG